MKIFVLTIYLIVFVFDLVLLHRSFIYDIIFEFSYVDIHLKKSMEKAKIRIPLEIFLAAIWPIRFLRYAFILIFK